MARKPALSVIQLLRWADAHHERTGKWPDVNAGRVYDARHEKWINIDENLRHGTRGLPGGWSLAALLAELRGKRNPAALPPHTVEQILAWADAHHARTGKWPIGLSGAIEEAPGEMWQAVDMALHAGLRGLRPGGTGGTLSRLLRQHRDVKRRRRQTVATQSLARHLAATSDGVTPREQESRANAMVRQIAIRRRGRNVQSLPSFTVDQILAWADVYHAKHGAWPKRDAGLIEGTQGESWGAVEIALSRGLRGLPAGSTLPRLLAQHRGTRHFRSLHPLTVEQILAWADAHRARTGEWPVVVSGCVTDAPSESWARINKALRAGRRSLPGGTTLARLLDRHRGTHKAQDPGPLNVRRILAWAEAYHGRHGKWPTSRSGVVTASPGDTWQAIELALRGGLRGLRGGTSLARLLAERRGKRNRAALTPLSEVQILAWADAYFARHGKWPTQNSGPIEDAPGETWEAIRKSLADGRRGLPGGGSLSVLLNRHRRRPCTASGRVVLTTDWENWKLSANP